MLWPILAGLAAVLWAAAGRARASSFVGPMPDAERAPEVRDALANRRAFLAAIRWAEGTSGANGYRALYGHTPAAPRLAGSLAAHPVQSGEWRGAPLTDAQCRGAGLGPGCITTAAGAYQMTLPTWTRMRQALSLPDFGPASQDQAALRLIADLGALQDIDAGRFDAAVAKLAKTWASLPGAGYAGQPEKSIAAMRQVYAGAGGTFA